MASIKGLTIEIDGNTTKLSKALFQVNKDSRDLQKELKDVDKLLKFDPQNTELLNRKQEILNGTFDNTNKKLETLKIASEQAFKQLEKGEITNEQFRTLQTEISKSEQELKKLNDELNKTSIEKIGNKFNELGNASIKLGKKLAPVSAIVGAVGVASFKTGKDFEDSMAKIKSTYGTIDNADEKYSKLSKSLKELSIEKGYDPTKVADAFQKVALTGRDVTEAIEFLPVVLDLAKASQLDLVTVSDQLTDALAGLGDLDPRGFSDKLIAGSQNANTEVTDLTEAIIKEGGNFKIFNGGIDETITLLSLLADKGIKGTESATSLRNVLGSLLNPESKSARKFIKQFGLEVADTEGEIRPLIDIMGDLNVAFEGLTDIEKQQALNDLFNKFDISVVNGLLGVQKEKYEELYDTIENASGKNFTLPYLEGLKMTEGKTKETAAEIDKTITGSLNVISASLKKGLIGVFEQMEPIIKIVLEIVKGLAEKFANLDEGTQKFIGIAGLILTALAPVLLIGGKIVTIVGGLIPLLGGLGTALGVLLSPIGLVVVAIGGLIAVFVTLYKKNEDFRDAVNEIWNGIKDLLKVILDEIVNTVKGFIELFNKIWSTHGDTIKETFKGVWEAVKTIFNGAKDIVIGILQTFTGLFTGDWTKFTDGITKIFKGLWEVLKGIVEGAWSLLKGAFNILATSIGNWFQDLIASAKNWGKDLISGFVDGIKEMWNGIKDTVGNIASSIGNFFTGGGSRSAFEPIGMNSRSFSNNRFESDDYGYVKTVNVYQTINTQTVNERLIEREAMRNFNKIKGGFFL